MASTSLEKQLQFLREIDRLKTVVRQSPLLDRSRKENSAEHSWHLALYALVLSEYASGPVDTQRVMRMLLLLAAGIGGLWGFAGGLVLVVVLIATNKTVGGKRRYLYPLIPWNGAAMKRLLVRERLKGARK